MLKERDAVEMLKSQPDFSADIVFCDPPYGLGSEVVIRADGKPDYSKAADFMSKWDMPTGDYWAEWSKEACEINPEYVKIAEARIAHYPSKKV